MEENLDINSGEAGKKNLENRGFLNFSRNKINVYFDYLARKSERLSIAIYMLTNLFDDEEPLKFHLRELSIQLVTFTLTLKVEEIQERQEQVKELILCVEEMLALAKMAEAIQIVSEMNYQILEKELRGFLADLDAKKILDTSESGFVIPRQFFEDNLPEKEESNLSVFETGNFMSKRFLDKAVSSLPANVSKSESERKGQYKGHYIKDTKSGMSLKASRNYKDLILKAFRMSSSKALTINDFKHSIKDCSEKTIQRKVLELVDQGVLKKEGERRWSKYSLKS